MPVKVRTSRWRLGRQTTYELRDMRSELEHAIETTPEHSESRAALQARLDNVLREQDSRAAAELASRQKAAEVAEGRES